MEENLLKERKETLMALMNDKAYVPMKLKELAILLGVPKEDGRAGGGAEGAHGRWEDRCF